MIGLALAALGSAGSILIAVRELARVRHIAPASPSELRGVLESEDGDSIRGALVSLFPDVGEELAAAMVGKRSTLGVSLLNEALGDIDRELKTGLGAGRSAMRVAFAAGTLGAVLELIAGLSGPGDHAWILAAPAFLVGAAGATACFELARRAAVAGHRARGEWDRIATTLGRRL